MFKSNFLKNYLRHAPIALAMERSEECQILSQQKFTHPILDIGCGDGIFSLILFNERIDTGIDPNSIELKRCSQLNMYKELIECKGDAVPKEDGAYNTIMSNSVLEHIHDLEPVLREAYRLLSATGSFYVTIPSQYFEKSALISRILGFFKCNRIQKKFNRFYNKFWVHYHCYDVETWKKKFTDCGFKVIEHREYAPIEFSSLNDFLVPFALPSFFTRRFLKRWFLFPQLRLMIAPLLYGCVRPFYENFRQKKSEKALIFLHLSK